MKDLAAAIEIFKEKRKELQPPIPPERIGLIDEAIRNSQPLLDLNNLDIRNALDLLETTTKQEVVITLVENKKKDRGVYLNKSGVFACVVEPGSDAKVSLGERFYGFMTHEIMDNFMFLHPKYNKEIDKKVEGVVDLIEGMLTGDQPPKLPECKARMTPVKEEVKLVPKREKENKVEVRLQ